MKFEFGFVTSKHRRVPTMKFNLDAKPAQVASSTPPVASDFWLDLSLQALDLAKLSKDRYGGGRGPPSVSNISKLGFMFVTIPPPTPPPPNPQVRSG